MAATVTPLAPSRYGGFTTMPLGGQWRAGSSGKVTTDTDPWSGATLTEIPLAGTDDLDDAFAAAERAQQAWAAQPPAGRAGVMRAAASVLEARRDEVTDWLIHETGAPVAAAELEWNLAREALLTAAALPYQVTGSIVPSDLPGRQTRVCRVPAGVIAAISPANFPLRLSSRTTAAALAAGNAVVLKPSSDTPVTGGLLIAKIFREAGLPAGLLSVVIASGAEVSEAITGHRVPRVISFAGSAAVGRILARQAGGKRLAGQPGTDGSLVVLEDADLARAADAAVFGSFAGQDQICMITRRITVHRKVYAEFTERLLTLAGCLRAGDPAAADTDIGPVGNARRLTAIRDAVERTRAEGARQLLGGEPDGPARLLLPPHVLLARDNVASTREELAGPVITIVQARDERDALRIANETGYGRSSAVFTRDIERGTRVALGLNAAMTHVNDAPVNGDATDDPGGHRAIGDLTAEHRVNVPLGPGS
jgi:aldehyde dehydrogenase (NAD+)